MHRKNSPLVISTSTLSNFPLIKCCQISSPSCSLGCHKQNSSMKSSSSPHHHWDAPGLCQHGLSLSDLSKDKGLVLVLQWLKVHESCDTGAYPLLLLLLHILAHSFHLVFFCSSGRYFICLCLYFQVGLPRVHLAWPLFLIESHSLRNLTQAWSHNL